MLVGHFFDLQSFTNTPDDSETTGFHAIMKLNAEHPVFGGHFPGNPVVPGVCQVQMVKELVEHAIGQHVNLVHSDIIKFLSMINPGTHPVLDCTFSFRITAEGLISTTASISSGAALFLKFKGKFEKLNNG